MRASSVLAFILIVLLSSCNSSLLKFKNQYAHFKTQKSKVHTQTFDKERNSELSASNSQILNRKEYAVEKALKLDLTKAIQKKDDSEKQNEVSLSSKKEIRKIKRAELRELKTALRDYKNQKKIKASASKFDPLGLFSFFLSMIGLLTLMASGLFFFSPIILLGVFLQIPALLLGVMAIYRHKMYDYSGHGLGVAGVVISSIILSILGAIIIIAINNEL